MPVNVLVLHLDGYDDWKVETAKKAKLKSFTNEGILEYLNKGHEEEDKIEDLSEMCNGDEPKKVKNTISVMGEENGYIFIKL